MFLYRLWQDMMEDWIQDRHRILKSLSILRWYASVFQHYFSFKQQSLYLYLVLFALDFFVHQLTGKIENMKIGILKEGFGLENSEEDVDKVVKEAAEQLGSECGAVVEEVSIPMHSDGNCHGVLQFIV